MRSKESVDSRLRGNDEFQGFATPSLAGMTMSGKFFNATSLKKRPCKKGYYMCRSRLKYSLVILLLFGHVQSHAVLTSREIDICYRQPWIILKSWFNKMEPIKQSTRPSCTNLTVQKIVINIPANIQAELESFDQPVIRVEILSVLNSNISNNLDVEKNFLDLVMVVHHADGTYQLALPEIISLSDKSLYDTKLHISEVATFISAGLSIPIELPCSYDALDKFIDNDKTFPPLYNLFYKKIKEDAKVDFYKDIPYIIFQSLVSKVQENNDLRRKSKNGMTMIFLGCGKGREVILGKETIREKLKVPVSSHGIDIQSSLIDEGKTKFSHYMDETCTLSTGDALDAESIIRKLVKKSKPDGIVIVIAIGLIASDVIPETYQAHKILQNIAQNQTVDMIFEARYGDHHYTVDTARAAGWAVEKIAITNKNQPLSEATVSQDTSPKLTNMLNILTPLSLKTQVESVVQKRSGNVLDLSLSSHPEKIFQKIVQQHHELTFDTVDISWGYLDNDELSLNKFISSIQDHGVNCVAVSGYEPWFKKFQSQIRLSSLNIIMRTDSSGELELPAIPLYLARQIWKDYEAYKKSSKIYHDKVTELSKEKIKLVNSEENAVVADDEDLSLSMQQLSLDSCPVSSPGKKQ